MRIVTRPTTWLAAAHGAVWAAVMTYFVLPLSVSAVTTAQPVCSSTTDACGNFISKYINPFILLLTVLIGVFAAISIVVAGIQYSTAGDDPGAVNKAKNRIFKTVIGLLTYFFLFGLLNYIIPGGFLH
jgi:hypothetical protein